MGNRKYDYQQCSRFRIAWKKGRGSNRQRSRIKFGRIAKKNPVIRQALEKNRPDPGDVLDVVAKVGGYDIAGMCGLF